MQPLKNLPSWQRLAEHRHAHEHDLRSLFAGDPRRFQELSLHCGNLLLDFSKNLLTRETLDLLVDLANARNLKSAIEDLFTGKHVNNTEDRAALHTALRAPESSKLDDPGIHSAVTTELARLTKFVAAVRDGSYTSYSGQAFTDIIHIGIGGSYLGPALAADALAPYAEKLLRVHYFSTVDGSTLERLLKSLDAARTLVIIASKTFGTQETFANAHAVKGWFSKMSGGAPEAIGKHFVAISAAVDAATTFGIRHEHIFAIWPWVGGRYSLCSTMGLPAALALGMEQFNQLRAGAAAMDAHFRTAPLEKNLPVVLGLLDVWYTNFYGTGSHVVLPYLDGFARLPSYLQQLEMESLGKHVTRDGEIVEHSSGMVVWGEAGTNGQHAFHQLLHQGTQLIPADFIIACRAHNNYPQLHGILLANALAQSEALMSGRSAESARDAMLARGTSTAEAQRLAPHCACIGNRPSTMIVLPEADPYHFGMLIALYEHKVYVQSVIWGINAFDQYGVELGKTLATRVEKSFASDDIASEHDASTAGLIRHIKMQQHNQRSKP